MYIITQLFSQKELWANKPTVITTRVYEFSYNIRKQTFCVYQQF